MLLRKCSFVCISSFHLLPLFTKTKRAASRDAVGAAVSAAFISRKSLAIIPPPSVKKVNLPPNDVQMNDSCLLSWIISQEMCVCVCVSLCLRLRRPVGVRLCVLSRENKMLWGKSGKRKRKQSSMMKSAKDLIEVPPGKLYCWLLIRRKEKSFTASHPEVKKVAKQGSEWK